MERIERLAAHMYEAVRLATSDHLEEQRLALLLLDSAAELMMLRESMNLLRQESYEYDQLVNLLRLQAWRPDEYKTPEFDTNISELRKRTTSKTRRRSIEYDFTAKVDFLVEKQVLDQLHGRILRRLHAYRNEAYHQDAVRRPTLTSAVQIYVAINCQVMASMTPGVIVDFQSTPPDSLAVFADVFARCTDPFEIQPAIAESLLRMTDVGGADNPSSALAINMLDRLELVEDILTELSNAWPERKWTPSRVLKQLQLEDLPENAFLSPAEMDQKHPRVGLHDFKRWRAGIDAVKRAPDTLSAFAIFADFEDEFEGVEHSAKRAMRAFDDYISLEIDRTRGG